MKPLIYIFLLASLCSCGTDENDSIVDCRIIGGEVLYDASGNYSGCVEPTAQIGVYTVMEYDPTTSN